jgi:hypothetical protein
MTDLDMGHASVLEMKYCCKERWIMGVHVTLITTNRMYIIVINACRE